MPKVGLGFRGRMRGELGSVGQEFDLLQGAITEWREKEHGIDGNHTTVNAETMTIAGDTTLGGPLFLSEDGVLTPQQITANTDNYAPPGIGDAVWLRLSTDASRNLTGLNVGNTQTIRLWLLTNVGNQDIVLKHGTTSTQYYRFACPGSVDFTLNQSDSVWLINDPRSGNVRVIGF